MSYQSRWATSTARGTLLSTELNSLANGSRSAAGTELDNATNRDELAIAELQVTFGSAPSSGGFVSLYAITAPDGTNYEDGSASVDPGAHRWLCNIPVRNVTTAQRLRSLPFQIDPFKTKFILLNSSGQAFPASGSTLKIYTLGEEFS